MYMNLEKWVQTFSPEQANRALLVLRIIYLKKGHSYSQIRDYLQETWNAERPDSWAEEKIAEEIDFMTSGFLDNKLLGINPEGYVKLKRKPLILLNFEFGKRE